MDRPTTISPGELQTPPLFTPHRNSFTFDHSLNDGSFAELSEALTAAQSRTSVDEENWLFDPNFRDLSNNSTAVSSPLTPGTPITRPKLGSRFSREVIRTLKNWLAIHQQHPYPTDEDMMLLQNQTGLNRAQLVNWFANARRRGKVHSVRPASPQVRDGSSSAVDIIPRPGTPAFRSSSSSKDPMQRWVDSPPEHEPAEPADIARAMASTSRRKSLHENDNEAWQSPVPRSPASSAGTSRSSEWSARHSSGSQSSHKIRKAPRRKRRPRLGNEFALDPSKPYLCTFCTESFRVRYDWQRHEKSLHLPLEKWMCAMHGPRAPKDGAEQFCCVFCGKEAPDDAHIEEHHYTACQERSAEERTFHRKDHLVQHLRLVHSAKFEAWAMSSWMLPIPNIRSRCGFCSLELNTWAERQDHLADHFKAGTTMAQWHGDWGFDDHILDMVENAVPPYFIEYERNTVIPMKGSDPAWGTPPNAYELLKVEIEFFVQRYFDKTSGHLPNNDILQLEACRIIYAAEADVSMPSGQSTSVNSFSWLCDLIMASTKIATQARFGPIRTSSESRHSLFKINGQDHLFEKCPLEAQLQAFVTSQQIMGITPDDGQIRNEACEIVRRMEKESRMPSDIFANWLVKGIYSSDWLGNFKRRVGIAGTSIDFLNLNLPTTEPTLNTNTAPEPSLQWPNPAALLPDQTVQNALAWPPNMPALHDDFLSTNPQLHMPTPTFPMPAQAPVQTLGQGLDQTLAQAQLPTQIQAQTQTQTQPSQGPPSQSLPNATPLTGSESLHRPALTYTSAGRPSALAILPEDTNFFRCFENDIRRWVAATMSPKNPNCHIPSDEEIQHQARWIVYDDDDPWNQTPADYAEWLWRFKRDMGILKE